MAERTRNQVIDEPEQPHDHEEDAGPAPAGPLQAATSLERTGVLPTRPRRPLPSTARARPTVHVSLSGALAPALTAGALRPGVVATPMCTRADLRSRRGSEERGLLRVGRHGYHEVGRRPTDLKPVAQRRPDQVPGPVMASPTTSAPAPKAGGQGARAVPRREKVTKRTDAEPSSPARARFAM